MIKKLESKENKISVIGLGYVGLPIALEFARKFSVIGFDINADRIAMMQQGIDPSNELDTSDFEDCDIKFTDQKGLLSQASFHIVAVPTPIDKNKNPDLRPIKAASNTVGKILKKGDYVVFESTVYPGCTEEDCVPILEAQSGLKFGHDFKVGYSPERINPGDKEHTLTKITKVVSGSDHEALDVIAEVYGSIISAGIYKASSIMVAEAAKIIENTQRDVNIALMNELSIIFSKMGINTFEVLEAAGTKWNFLKFTPGLVGGHCIGVDPYYLTHKAKEVGYQSKVILSGRNTNDSMGALVAKQVLKHLIDHDKNPKESKVLVMGITFKENVSDIRNSKVIDVIRELESFKIEVDIVDPQAGADEVYKEYGLQLAPKPKGEYDAIIVAVNHMEFLNLDEDFFMSLSNGQSIIYDIKGIFRGKINRLTYQSL